jgi:drug/metabolite transporter (DMT)-like permease
MATTEALTVVLALTSSASRAGLNVVDRRLFGHLRLPIITGSAVNNVGPAVVGLLACALLSQLQAFWEFLLDWRIALFGAIVQIVAFVFGYAFRETPISRVVMFTKLSDLLIPIGIYAAIGAFSARDYLFSVATVLACVPVVVEAIRSGRATLPPLLITGLLALQGSVSPLLVHDQRFGIKEWLTFTSALLVWRLVLSLALAVLPGARDKALSIGSAYRDLVQEQLSAVLARAALAVFTQATFLMAIGLGHAAIAWPILNCTALFAMIGAAIILGERPTKAEIVACTLVLTCVAIKYVTS